VCYGCGKPGHIKTNCPEAKKPAEAAAVKSFKQGAWFLSGEPREGPYLAVDLNTKGQRKYYA
jgi:hypothetical protein